MSVSSSRLLEKILEAPPAPERFHDLDALDELEERPPGEHPAPAASSRSSGGAGGR